MDVGHNVMIDAFFHCTTQLELGDYIHIASHVGVGGGEKGFLRMDHFSAIASGCQIVCGTDDYTYGRGLRNSTVPMELRNVVWAPVILEPFVTLGVNTTILPGVKLAIGSCVGANSLVTKDTEPWTMYVGSPARPLQSIPQEIILGKAKELGYEF
jgi:acetyltransferase-like isoleucine patch superfamily enzyme